MAEQGHFWKYDKEADRWVCSRCSAATYDTLGYSEPCMTTVDQQDKKEFLTALQDMSNGAYEVLGAWEGSTPLSDLLNTNQDLLDQYRRCFELSFDEWFAEFQRFKEVAEKVVMYSLKTGDCLNCIRGFENPRHNKDYHSGINDACRAQGCDCLSYTPLKVAMEL